MCRVCGSTVESKHRHDFVSCKCGSIAVDGGKAYLKRVGNCQHWADMSQYEKCSECGTEIEYLSPYSQPDHPLFINQTSGESGYPIYQGMWYCPRCDKEYK